MAYRDEEDAISQLGLTADPEDQLASDLNLKPIKAAEPISGPVGPSGGEIRPNVLEGTKTLAKQAQKQQEEAYAAHAKQEISRRADPRGWSLDETKAYFKEIRDNQGALNPQQEAQERQLIEEKKAIIEAPERAAEEKRKAFEKEARTGFIERFNVDFKSVAKKLAMFSPSFAPIALGFEAANAASKTKPFQAAVRGAAHQVASMPQVVGGLTREFGENMETRPEFWKTTFEINPYFSMARNAAQLTMNNLAERTNIDERLVSLGTKMRSDNEAYIRSRPDLYERKGDMWEHLFYDLGSGAASIAESLGLAAVATPAASAAFFGMYQKGQIYNEARDKGLSPEDASRVSSAAGLVEGGLEAVGVNKFLGFIKKSGMAKKVGEKVTNRIAAIITEGLQETAQQAGEEALTQKKVGISAIRDDAFKDVAGRVFYSGLIGSLVAAPTTVFYTAADDLGLSDELKRQGIKGDKAREIQSKIVEAVRQEATLTIEENVDGVKAIEPNAATPEEDAVLQGAGITQTEEPDEEEAAQPASPDVAHFDEFLEKPKSKAESSEADFIRTNFERFDKAYNEQALEEYGSSNVVSSDLAKTISVDGRAPFSGKLSAVRHEPSSAYAKAKYEALLKEPTGKPVLIMAGVSGAGKTSALKNAGINLDTYAAVYDTNVNKIKTGDRIIEKALASDPERIVQVFYVQRDPIKAFNEGVYYRFKTKPERRIVPIDAHIENIGASKTIKEIAAKYKDNDRVQVFAYDNNVPKGTVPIEVPIDKLDATVYNSDEVRNELRQFIEKERSAKALSEEEALTFLGEQSQQPEGSQRTRQEEPDVQASVSEDDLVLAGFMPIGGGSIDPFEFATPKEQVSAQIVRGDEIDPADLKEYPDLARIKKQLDQVRAAVARLRKDKAPIPASYVKAGEALVRELGFDPAFLKRNAPSAGRLLGQPKPKEVRTNEQAALAERLKAEERGARYGYKAGVMETRADLISRFKTRMSEIEANRAEVYEYLKENLPLQSRGKFLALVRDAKTPIALARAFIRVDAEVQNLIRKDLVGSIKKRLTKLKDSEAIAVDFKSRVQALVEGIDLTRRQEETMQRLKATRDYIAKERAAGRDPEMPQRILNAVAVLDKKPLNQTTIPELEDIIDKMDALIDQGETKLRARENIVAYDKARILREIAANPRRVKTEKMNEDLPPVGEKATVPQRVKNFWIRKLNFASLMDLSITPMDAVFDHMDGDANYTGPILKNFKKRQDGNFSNYLDLSNDLKDRFWDLYEDGKMNKQNSERLGLYAAAADPGARAKLLANGYTEAELDAITLSPAEMKLYNLWRQVADKELRPRASKVLREVYNKELGEVEDYFPMTTDFKALSEAEVAARFGEQVSQLGGPARKNVERGFTQERTGDTRQKIKLDFMEVVTRHIDNAAYFINMAGDNKALFELANTDDFKNLVGDRGQAIMLEWLDLLARKGGSAGDQQIALLDTMRKNIGVATLGLKLSSIMVQTTSLLDGAGLIGNYAFSGMRDVATSKEWRTFLQENFSEIKARTADDPAFTEFSDNKTLAEIQEKGFWALQKIDGIVASSIAAGAYQQYLDQHGEKLDFSKPNEEAIKHAELMVRRTQASAQFKDLPLLLSRGKFSEHERSRSLAKLVFQFQTFMLGRWSLIRHDLVRLGIQQKDFAKAGNIAAMLLLANGAELGIRRLSKEIIEAITGGNYEEREEFWDMVRAQLLSNVPFVSQAVSTATYGGFPVPSISILTRLIDKAQKRLVDGKRDETKIKGVVNALEAAATAFGLPGAAQLGDIAENAVDKL